MKKLIFFSLLLVLFSACKDDKYDQDPGIEIKIDNEVFTGDTIAVKLNEYQELMVTAKGSGMRFYRQLNKGELVDIRDSEDFRFISQSYDGIQTLVAEIYTDFSGEIYKVGDVIRIKITASDLTRSVYYSIEE